MFVVFVLSVVYADQLLGAAPTRKLVKLIYSAVFNLFTPEINKNHLKMNKKFFSFFAYFSKLVDLQKLVDFLRGYPKIIFFWLIFLFSSTFFVSFHKRRFEIKKKLKTAEKGSLTSTPKLVEIHNICWSFDLLFTTYVGLLSMVFDLNLNK